MPKLIAAVALVVAATLAQPLRAERTLYWSSIEVDARLDASGRLRVRETLHYVFDGDWNGGERTFRLAPGQKVEVQSVTRVERGREKRLARGNLDRIDHFDWTGPGTLRWRSRMPDDPPFRNAPITYVLDYTYSNIVIQRPRGYLLDHAFLFADRAGPIERFTLDLRLDAPWKAEARTFHRELDFVPSGQNAVLRIPLEYAAAGAPAYVRPRAVGRPNEALRDPRPVQRGVIVALVLGAAIAWLLFAWNEKRVGRFDPLPVVGRRWLEENLLPIRAETIGAAWDGEVQQAEVAALLARLVAEGKIETATIESDGGPELHMTLKVPHQSFSGYERKLIDKFFFDGMETDTASIRTHYRSSGLDPAALIRPGIVAEVQNLSGEPAPQARAGKILAVFVLFFLVLAVFTSPSIDRIWAIIGAVTLAATFAASWFAAMRWQRRPDLGRADSFWLLLPWGMSIAAVAWLFGFRLPAIVQIAFALSGLSGMAASATMAHSTGSAAGVAFRRKLAAVRNFFRMQLRRAEPSLEDAWFPYVLAFGLGKDAEKWFRAFGGTTNERRPMSGWTHGQSSPGGAGWTGGGGAFGGGGASGTWIAAASGMAAGIAAPSSGGGGGGGFSGGGGSSGGGGGGGW